jgi:hypothetical protein
MSREAKIGGATSGMSLRPRQRTSHRRLIKDRSGDKLTRNRVRPLDAFVVPAGRRAHHLRNVVQWAAEYDARLVILASHDCDISEAARIVSQSPRCRALIVDVPPAYSHPDLVFYTSAQEFQRLSAGRRSNLSLKRNLGLLLARLMGWEKIMFIDDDVIKITGMHFARVANCLESNKVTGLATMWFPDNSVVCHANRLSGADQDVFVSGATLGVNVDVAPLDFFPDIYNEDWLAFASLVQGGEVASAGYAGQLHFNPYEDPQRAAREEFGDLIAEGLYALFGDGWGLESATKAYWVAFMGARKRLIDEIHGRLAGDAWTHESVQAQHSLEAARGQLDLITPADCLDFVAAWRFDRGLFAKRAHRLPVLSSFAAVCDYLQLPDWREAEFGSDNVPHAHRPTSRLEDYAHQSDPLEDTGEFRLSTFVP